MSALGERIRQLRLSRNMSQADLGKILNVSNVSVSGYENGTREPDSKTLKLLATTFDVSTDYLLGNNSLPSNTASIDESTMVSFPIVGTIKAGPDGFAMSDYEGRMATISEGINLDNDHIWLKVNGNSMLGDGIRDGDLALIELSDAYDDPKAIYAVVYDGELGSLKRVKKTDSAIILLPSNPEVQPIVISDDDCDTFRIVGKLKQSVRNYS